jgi:hypothetical protein
VKVVASTRMLRVERYGVFAEQTLLHFFHKNPKDPLRREYFRNLRILQFMRGTWDAMLCSFQLVVASSIKASYRRNTPVWLPNSRTLRAIERIRTGIVWKPLATAKSLKALGGMCRAWFFGQRRPTHSLVQFPTKWYGNVWSYIQRALPPPPKDPSLIDELIGRLTGVPVPEQPEWRAFCKNFLTEFRPEGTDFDYPTSASSGGSYGYTRLQGGMARAVSDLTSLGICLLSVGEDPQSVAFGAKYLDGPDKSQFLNGKEPSFRHPTSMKQMNALAMAAYGLPSALLAGVKYVLDRLRHLPIVPLVAEERGLKCRFPTETLVAGNLVMQILRRASDLHQIRDPRMSKSLGGKLDCHLGPKGPYYSQDLSLATDMHPFWLTRTYYEEILSFHPKLEWTRDYFDLLFGPKKIIRQKDMDDPPLFPEGAPQLSAPSWERERSWELSEMAEYIANWDAFLLGINEKEGPLTTLGAMMGDATSFPGLPMVSAWALWRAAILKAIMCGDDLLATLAKCPLPPVINEPESSFVHPAMRQMVSELKGKNTISADERRRLYEAAITECGGVLSLGDPEKGKPNKIFFHQELGSFCEQVLYRGKFLAHIPTSLVSAPPGGSKGELNWFNQPSALLEHAYHNGTTVPKRIWRTSPHYVATRAAYKLGIPAREPVALGGVSHPLFPHNAGGDSYLTQRWLSALSQITIGDWATGTGLSPLPQPGSSLARKLTRKWVDGLVGRTVESRRARTQLERTERPWPQDVALAVEELGAPPLTTIGTDKNFRRLPSIEEAAETAGSLGQSYLLYGRAVPETFLHTPSMGAIAGKFRRRVTRARLRPGQHGYHRTVADIRSKLETYVVDPESEFPGYRAPRLYGIMPARPSADQRSPWMWEWGRQNNSRNFQLFGMERLGRS